MGTTYEWLYDNYAKNTLEKLDQSGRKAIEELSRELDLTEHERFLVREKLEGLRLNWGAEVFALGLQLGMRLTLPE